MVVLKTYYPVHPRKSSMILRHKILRIPPLLYGSRHKMIQLWLSYLIMRESKWVLVKRAVDSRLQFGWLLLLHSKVYGEWFFVERWGQLELPASSQIGRCSGDWLVWDLFWASPPSKLLFTDLNSGYIFLNSFLCVLLSFIRAIWTSGSIWTIPVL